VVLNICERIGVRVPVDLSILVTWRIVAFAVPVKHGLAKTLKSAVCLFILPYPVYAIFTLWPYFSIYYSCVYNAKMNLWLMFV
jgi:hypothetical protein